MNDDTFLELLDATEFIAIVTNGSDGPHLVGTWGDYARRLGSNAATIVVPAGGYHQTEKNLARDNRIKLLIASRSVEGSTGPGQAYQIDGTAALVTAGPTAEAVKQTFSWARGALVISVEEIVAQL